MSVESSCSTCGSPRAAAPRIPQAGLLTSNVAAAVERSPFWAPPVPETNRGRPWTHPGLAFALVCLSFGLYAFYWFFATWREIKRHDGDEGKRPVGHALAVLVPVYGLFRVHAHMRTIGDLVRSSGGLTSLSPGTAVIVWILANALCALGSRGKLGLALNVLGVLLEGGMVAWAQAALNRAWYLQDPHAPMRPTHPGNWVALGIGAIVSLLVLIGLAS